MNDKLYDDVDTLEDCHTWLIHAMQEYPIPQNKMGHYTTSYVAIEYLTSIAKEDDEFFFLKLVFPMLYETFVKKCVYPVSKNHHMSVLPHLQLCKDLCLSKNSSIVICFVN